MDPAAVLVSGQHCHHDGGTRCRCPGSVPRFPAQPYHPGRVGYRPSCWCSCIWSRRALCRGTGMAPQAAGPAHAPAPARLVTVMALNVGAAGVDSTTLFAEVRARKVDILALPELQPLAWRPLRVPASRPPSRTVPWTSTGPAWAVRSFPGFRWRSQARPGSSFYQSRAAVSVPGVAGGIHLTAVHVASPRPGQITNWRQELQQLGDLGGDCPVLRRPSSWAISTPATTIASSGIFWPPD